MTNDRAVSTLVGYVIGLGIIAILISLLLISSGDFIEDQRKQAIRSELQVVGQQVSNEISRVDRMVVSSTPTSDTVVEGRTPEDVAGLPYQIELVTSTPNSHLVLTTSQPDVRVRVNLTASTTLEQSTLDGGTYQVVYDPSTDEILITDER